MTYELINKSTANSVAAFADERDAVLAYHELAAGDPDLAADLLIVAFDEEGEALEAHPAAERAAALP